METAWFVIWGVLWGVYFMLDGYDLGIGSLYPFIGKNDKERHALHEAIGPFWDGNEVWLITAGGVTFAAFPGAYALMFSTLYTPLMLILFALILRGAGLAFRIEAEGRLGRLGSDILFFTGSLVPAILFGVAFANLFAGIPITADKRFDGNLLSLLTPYGLLGGILFLLFFLQHGATWIAIKNEGDLEKRGQRVSRALWIPLVLVAVLFLLATARYTPLYENYLKAPALFILPGLAVAGLLLQGLFLKQHKWWHTWGGGCAFIFFATLFGVVGMYPNMVPSNLPGGYTANLANSASSPLTLKIMFGVVLVVIPLVIAYQAWAVYLFRHKTEGEEASEGFY